MSNETERVLPTQVAVGDNILLLPAGQSDTGEALDEKWMTVADWKDGNIQVRGLSPNGGVVVSWVPGRHFLSAEGDRVSCTFEDFVTRRIR